MVLMMIKGVAMLKNAMWIADLAISTHIVKKTSI